MFDAEDELAIASGEMLAPHMLSEEELREPISSLDSRPAETIHVEATISEAIGRMKRAKVGSLAVVDGAGMLVGIVTERDLLTKVLLEPVDPATTSVRTIMTPDPETLLPSDAIVFAMNKMQIGGFRHVPIVDESGKPVCVLSIRDVVGYVLRVFEPAIMNLPPDAFPHLRRFA